VKDFIGLTLPIMQQVVPDPGMMLGRAEVSVYIMEDN
jgi:hypothetical protein